MKNLLITGGAGFIGANFLHYFLKDTDWNIGIIDSFRHKGTYTRINQVINLLDLDKPGDRVKVYNHDLNAPIDLSLVSKMIGDFSGFDYIINLASNSAIERSVSDPAECWNNNCSIAINMLEMICDGHLCDERKSAHPLKVFLHMSTDEVYGDYIEENGNQDGYTEWSPINPSNPYSASKAAQEALMISYWRTYRLPIIICNTMNNIGWMQDPEKFVPKLISNILKGETSYIYKSKSGIIGGRKYLDVMDHAKMVHAMLLRGAVSSYPKHNRLDRFNLCGDFYLSNSEMAELVYISMSRLRIKMGDFSVKEPYRAVDADSLRPGYDRSYKLSNAKFKKEFLDFNYTPIQDTIDSIIKFTIKNREFLLWTKI